VAHDFDEYCPCGWKLGSKQPHNHAERLRAFWRAALAKNPPKFKAAKQRPNRRRRKELVDAD
jgi:hypothetical protein